jgi:hypothetical protein
MLNGFYARVLGRDVSCEVCGDRFLVEEHHEIFDHKTGSDLDGPVHWLCVYHHQLIHRGLADYENGKYVDRRERVKQGLDLRVGLFPEYLSSMRLTTDDVARTRRIQARQRSKRRSEDAK